MNAQLSNHSNQEYAMKPIIIIPAWGSQLYAHGGCDGGCDGDCACALPAKYQQNNFLVGNIPHVWQQSQIWQTSHGTIIPLINDKFILSTLGMQAGWAVINEPARDVFDFFSSPHAITEWPLDAPISAEDFETAAFTFYQAGFLTSQAEASLAVSKTYTKPALETWLFLTRSCNMACVHCFVSKDTRQMTLETGLEALEKLFQLAEQNGHPGIKIKYAGGEPTLRWDLVTALHEHATDISRGTNIPFSEILVTNGAALSWPRLEYLKEENIQLSVSIDGFGDGHDRQRSLKNGKPSFKIIFDNINTAIKMGLRPYLTITLTALNLKDLPALTQFAIQNQLFLNWNFYRPNSINDPLLPDYDELIDTMQRALDVARQNMAEYSFFDKLVDRSNFSVPHKHTCGAGINYLSVDYDGSTLPCHMLSGANHLGIPLASISRTGFENFDNPSVDTKTECNCCEWRYWCAGGCPVLSKTLQSPISQPSYYCKVYKAIYPELIKIKGLQLLTFTK